MMNFRQSTEEYEAWLGSRIPLLPKDLALKHDRMREALFPFLRSTFYRWAQLWPEVCPEFHKAVSVLAVGDLHVENFGTWRDSEGRLVWGINDFDEASVMPWTVDLVRLGTSAHMAIDAGHLRIDHREACDSIVAGYRDGLTAGGRPWVLGEKHAWLSQLVDIKDPEAFWGKLYALPTISGVPKDARRAVEKMLPDSGLEYRLAHRVAGLGSLGRQRFVALAEYAGASVCREAKALAPSAWVWAAGGEGSARIQYQKALDTAVRAIDPFVRLKNRWIVRRLAPDCTRIELTAVPKDKEKGKLLQAMGWETANVHSGSGKNAAILRDLAKRPPHWLHEAAERMVKAATEDWNAWRTPVLKAKAR